MITDTRRLNRTTPGTPRSSRTPPPTIDHSPVSEELEAEETSSQRTRKPSRILTSPSYVLDTPSIAQSAPTIQRALQYESDESTQLSSPSSSRILFEDENDDEWGNNDPIPSSPQIQSDSENNRSSQLSNNSNTWKKGKERAVPRERYKKNSPREEELFDVEQLDSIDIDDIDDPTVVAAIAKSKKAEIESRGVDVMNDLDQDMPISSLVDEDMVSTSARFDDTEEVRIAKEEFARIQENHEVGEFSIPVSLLTIPSSKDSHRSMSRSHAKNLAYSLKLNAAYSIQPALGMIDLDSSDQLYLMIESVRKEKNLSRKYGKMTQVIEAMKNNPKTQRFVVHGSTHSLTAFVANKKAENIPDDQIEYKVKVYLNLTKEDKSTLATRHNAAASVTMKESTVDVLKNCRKIVESKLRPLSNGEYLLPKDIKVKLKSMYGNNFNEHVYKGLCLGKKNFALLQTFVNRKKPGSFSFLENFNVSFPIDFKTEILTKLSNNEMNEGEFKQFCRSRSRRINIISLLLKEKWCVDRKIQTIQQIQTTLPDIYNKVAEGAYDAVFSRYNFKEKQKKKEQAIPHEFIQHFVRLTTAIDKPDLSSVFLSDEAEATPNEVHSKLLALHRRNTWDTCHLIKIHDTCHLTVRGTLNDADLLRTVALAPDLVYLTYHQSHKEMLEEELYQDFGRLVYQFPGGKLNDAAFLVISDRTVSNNCSSRFKEDLKMKNIIPAQFYLRSTEHFQDKFQNFLLVFPISRQITKKHTRNMFIFDAAPNEEIRSKEDIAIDEHQVPMSQDLFMINFLTRRDSLILSVFAGVGTTACAAAMCGRNSISFEPDKDKYDALVDRLIATKNIVEADVFMEPSSVPMRIMNENEYKKACETEIKKHLITLQRKDSEKKRMRETEIYNDRNAKRVCDSPSVDMIAPSQIVSLDSSETSSQEPNQVNESSSGDHDDEDDTVNTSTTSSNSKRGD